MEKHTPAEIEAAKALLELKKSEPRKNPPRIRNPPKKFVPT